MILVCRQRWPRVSGFVLVLVVSSQYCSTMSVVNAGGLSLGLLHHGDLDAEQSLALDLLVLLLLVAAGRLHPVQLAEHLGLLEQVHHVRKLIPHEPLARLHVPADAAQ